jgi:hypothetical protein
MLARTGLVFALGFEDISKDALQRAQFGEVVIMTDDREERVRALVRLSDLSDLYPYVGRFIESRVLAHRDEVHLAAAQYERLEGQRSGFQITFAVIYILVAMLFLAAAISIGIHFAAQLADPISRLVGAAERVRAGDLSVQAAVENLAVAPVAHLGFAHVDLERRQRCGFPEVIFCQGKTPEQVFADFKAFVEKVHARRPEMPIAYISIAPNPARWAVLTSVRSWSASPLKAARHSGILRRGHVGKHDHHHPPQRLRFLESPDGNIDVLHSAVGPDFESPDHHG